MRRRFEQYVNLRPAYLYDGVQSPLRDKAPGLIDMLVYRENTEGEYAPIGGHVHEGFPGEVAIQTSVFTRTGCARIMRAAFEGARKRRKFVTSITKSNALGFSMVLWDRVFIEVARDYPDVRTNSLLVDAAAMDFVRKPEVFDVVVASNLFGDILTDLSAILTGSMGLAASANINPDRKYPSMFEPVHGSAPDIAGKGISNPLAAILSGGQATHEIPADPELESGLSQVFIAIDPAGSIPLETYRQDSLEEAAAGRQLFETFMQTHNVPGASGPSSGPSYGWLDNAPAGEVSDILKRLMQKREQELQK
jgi:isocitrate dehydrogenase